MEKIEEISLVQFQERKYGHQGDHIVFVHSNECASSIGRIGGEQELHLSWDCITETNVIHEVKIFFMSRLNSLGGVIEDMFPNFFLNPFSRRKSPKNKVGVFRCNNMYF